MLLQAICRRLGAQPLRVAAAAARSYTTAAVSCGRISTPCSQESERLELSLQHNSSIASSSSSSAATSTSMPPRHACLPMPHRMRTYHTPLHTRRSMWSMGSVSPVVATTPLVGGMQQPWRMMSTLSSDSDDDHQSTSVAEDAHDSVAQAVDTSIASNTSDSAVAQTVDSVSTAVAGSETFLSEVAVAAPRPFYWVPCDWIESALMYAHGLGWPWWVTIFGATIGVRTFLLPIMTLSIKNSAIMTNLKPELEALKHKHTARPGQDPGAANAEYKAAVQELFRSNNVNPLKSIVPALVQIPIFLFFFFTLRDMAHVVPSFAEGGTLWFKNLSVNDPYYRLPMLASLTMLASIEASTMVTSGPQTHLQRIMKRVFQGFAIALVPLTGGMPQAIHWYWIASNLFTFGQTMLLSRHWVKNALGIPIAMPTTLLGSPTAPEPVKTFGTKPSKSTIAAAVAAGKQRKSFERKK